jgi:hypothetical protein
MKTITINSQDFGIETGPASGPLVANPAYSASDPVAIQEPPLIQQSAVGNAQGRAQLFGVEFVAGVSAPLDTDELAAFERKAALAGFAGYTVA